jgi:ribosomal protein L11
MVGNAGIKTEPYDENHDMATINACKNNSTASIRLCLAKSGFTSLNGTVNQIEKKANEQGYMYYKYHVNILHERSTRNIRDITLDAPTSTQIRKKQIPQTIPPNLYKYRFVGREHTGNVHLSDIVTVAKKQRKKLNGASLQECVMTVLGACRSCELTVNYKRVDQIQQQILDGWIQITDNCEILFL